MTVDCMVFDDACGLRVELTGRFGLGDVADLQLCLMQCLAEQPDALLVDLTGMAVDEPSVLDVLSAVSLQAGHWPCIPLLVCVPPSPVRDLLADARRHSPLFRSAGAARDHAAAHHEVCPMISEDLFPIAGTARYARNLATEACLRWDLPNLVGPASLIVSELVSNVIDHAGTMCTVQFSLQPAHLAVSVRDGAADEPVAPQPVSPTAPRGRGLMIVDSVADRWGWLPSDGGKVVWALLAR